MTFLGVPSLAQPGQITLQQDELFGDLWVQDPAGIEAEAEALADGGAIEE
jgi:segregation and condensation protein A